jgi:hypothetical protein
LGTVFGIFRAAIRTIDVAKRAVLSRMLLQSVLSTAPGEKLDDKLAALALPATFNDRACWIN